MTWILFYVLASAPQTVLWTSHTSAAACYAAQGQLHGAVASACLERRP